jgi:hypothetical protein
MWVEHLRHFVGQHLGEMAAALAGAIAGSFSAYWLQRWNERKRDWERKRGEIVKAQTVLLAQLNTLRNLWEKSLQPLENKPKRENLFGVIRFIACEPTLDINAIAFLVTRKTPSITLDVHLAQRSYLNAMDALRVRNELVDQVVFGSDPKAFDGNALTVNADARLIFRLKAETDNLFETFPKAIKRCTKMVEELRKLGRERYSTWYSRLFGDAGFLRVTNNANAKTDAPA